MPAPLWYGHSARRLLQVRAVPFAQVTDCLVGESVEAASRDILFELFVPGGGVEAEKPIAERGQIAAREPLDGVLNVKNGAHAGRNTAGGFQGKRSAWLGIAMIRE